VTKWESNMFTSTCGEVPDRDYVVIVPTELHHRFLTLIKEYDTEWLMYLTYNREENEEVVQFEVTGYVFPNQEVSTATVREVESPVGDYGVIHAHQFSSSKFFSQNDDDHVNSNNAFSLVINGEGEYLGKTRVRTPCNKYVLKECEIVVKFNEYEDIKKEYLEHAKKPPKTKYNYNNRYPVVYYGDYDWMYGGYTWQGSRQSYRGYNKQQTTLEQNLNKPSEFDCPFKGTNDNPDRYNECTETDYYRCIYYNPECPLLVKRLEKIHQIDQQSD